MVSVTLRDGEKLHVTCVGKGRPVMLMHGFGSRGAHWLHNVLPYSRQFRFYLPDLRGFGNSHHANLDGLDVFATYANDMEDVLNHFELDQVILGGVSTGAYSCLTYNQLYGFSRVSKYLNIEHGPDSCHGDGQFNGIFREQQAELFAIFQDLLDLAQRAGPIAYWELPPEHRLQFRNTVVRVLSQALHKGFARQVVTLAARLAEPLLTRYFMPVEKWQTYLHVMQAFMNGRDTRLELANIKVPTTLMIGRQSQYFSVETQLEIARYVPHAKVVIFEQAGHAVMVDQPIEFQREFGRFLFKA